MAPNLIVTSRNIHSQCISIHIYVKINKHYENMQADRKIGGEVGTMQAEDAHLYSQTNLLIEKEALAYPLCTAKLRNIEGYVGFFFF